jgi:hypothetical protein
MATFRCVTSTGMHAVPTIVIVNCNGRYDLPAVWSSALAYWVRLLSRDRKAAGSYNEMRCSAGMKLRDGISILRSDLFKLFLGIATVNQQAPSSVEAFDPVWITFLRICLQECIPAIKYENCFQCNIIDTREVFWRQLLLQSKRRIIKIFQYARREKWHDTQYLKKDRNDWVVAYYTIHVTGSNPDEVIGFFQIT